MSSTRGTFCNSSGGHGAQTKRCCHLNGHNLKAACQLQLADRRKQIGTNDQTKALQRSAAVESAEWNCGKRSALLVPDMPLSKKATTQVRWASPKRTTCNGRNSIWVSKWFIVGGWNTPNSDTWGYGNHDWEARNTALQLAVLACCSNRTQGSSFNITLGQSGQSDIWLQTKRSNAEIQTAHREELALTLHEAWLAASSNSLSPHLIRSVKRPHQPCHLSHGQCGANMASRGQITLALPMYAPTDSNSHGEWGYPAGTNRIPWTRALAAAPQVHRESRIKVKLLAGSNSSTGLCSGPGMKHWNWNINLRIWKSGK